MIFAKEYKDRLPLIVGIVSLLTVLSLSVQAQHFKKDNSPDLHTSADSLKIAAMLKEARKISYADQRKGVEKAKKALSLSSSLNYPKGIADASIIIAEMSTLIENGDSVKILCNQALEIYLFLNDHLGIADAYSTLGYTAYLKGDYKTSKNYYNLSLERYKKVKNQSGIANVQNSIGLIYWSESKFSIALDYFHAAEPYNIWATNNIGLIYLDLLQDSLALTYFNKVLTYCDSVGDEIGKAIAFGNIGEAYRSLKNDSLALGYYNKSLEISYQQESLEGIAFCLKCIGIIKAQQNEADSALSKIKAGLEIYTKLESKEGIGTCNAELAKIYVKINQPDKAISHGLIALNLANELNSKFLKSNTAQVLSSAYKAKNEFEKALEFNELYLLQKDSMMGVQNIRQIEGLRYGFQLEKKEIENIKLKQEKELQEAKTQRQFLFLLIIAFVLMLVLILLFIMWRTGSKTKELNRILRLQKHHIEQQNISLSKLYEKTAIQRDDLLILNEEKELQQKQIMLQNEELKLKNEKLAELDREKDGLMSVVAHDLKSPLNSTLGLTQLIRLTGPLNSEQETYLQLIEKTVRDGGNLIGDLLSITEAQHSNTELKYSVFELTEWLANIISAYKIQANKKRITIELSIIIKSVTISTDAGLLSRVLDNLISNAIKFSKPGKNIVVTLYETPEGIAIQVSDEGPGISETDQKKLFKKFQRLTAQPTQGESSTGLGLAIVKALTDKLNGKIEVNSKLGQGTSFTLTLPQSVLVQEYEALNL